MGKEWILQALRIIAAAGLGGAAFQTGAELMPFNNGPGGPGEGGYGEYYQKMGIPQHKHKRRRRRRALTASDRGDIAFITGLLGATAGKNFAVTLAGRSR